jgi:putative hemolysin
MCPFKWQTQYNLTEKMTPVNTRALLLILEKIKNNAEVETKPTSTIKPKRAEVKRKIESITSRISQKSKQVGFSNKYYALCKKHGGPHKLHNTHDYCKYNHDGTPIKRNGGAGRAQWNRHADKNHSIRESMKGQIMLR